MRASTIGAIAAAVFSTASAAFQPMVLPAQGTTRSAFSRMSSTPRLVTRCSELGKEFEDRPAWGTMRDVSRLG